MRSGKAALGYKSVLKTLRSNKGEVWLLSVSYAETQVLTHTTLRFCACFVFD